MYGFFEISTRQQRVAVGVLGRSLIGYSPGTTSSWTRDEGWTVSYPNGTVIKREGDGWTVTTEDEDD